ncbi:MAG: TetR/AcrR family transcriptional regulator [Burkholderiaceae bacterium]|jgi:AcrR family transcriptional regulator|nr:TetR/AcrR family transcriptional regulator [Burkholderiales bacterium]MCZ8336651.1 TetR/AcrR family transcriptional regulator [Burkholderiaceae bacterium]
MQTQRKAPRRTRERILELSLRLFNEQGEPQVTTSAIADEMNISPGNLYYHFRNKDDIVNALFEQYEREMEGLLRLPGELPADVEEAWLFLHLMFETIWRHRFVYRDLSDLLTRNRRVETHFPTILEGKSRAARRLCDGLAAAGQLHATDFEIDALATNMVVVATWWLQYEYVLDARRFGEPEHQAAALARGAFQVLALTGAYLSGDARALFERLASEYLRTPDDRGFRPPQPTKGSSPPVRRR